jgi:hypothetical protein
VHVCVRVLTWNFGFDPLQWLLTPGGTVRQGMRRGSDFYLLTRAEWSALEGTQPLVHVDYPYKFDGMT